MLTLIIVCTAEEMKLSIKDFFSKCDHLSCADLLTFTEEILNGKLIFCAVMRQSIQVQEWTK